MAQIPDWLQYDHDYIWHPYSSIQATPSPYPVIKAEACRIYLADGRSLIDGMASWWCMIHGYNHPHINAALIAQIEDMSHVMFGGLTHEPAARLAKKLVTITPAGLDKVFFADSGSVAIEVAMKMAIQYWHALGKENKTKFLTVRQGYHGDTLGAMSVCDPVTGMHSLFNQNLTQQYFVPAPAPEFDQKCEASDLSDMQAMLQQHANNIAAVVIEPIVQGAGGMRFYAPDYLNQLHQLCQQHDVLLVFDEIATGFGRTGKLFATQYTNIEPDIMCVGKALTGGYLSLAATLTSAQIADTISAAEPGVFMHGPTFMANPLACRAALASLELLENSDYLNKVQHIENILQQELLPCVEFKAVKSVRVLGAIGVVEMHEPVNMQEIVPAFVQEQVWIRPFGKLVYIMPPFIISNDELHQLTNAINHVLSQLT